MKYKLLILTTMLLSLTVGCIRYAPIVIEDTKTDTETMKLVEENHTGGGSYYQILVDTNTNVTYLFTKNGYGGGLSVMLNADGSPKLYKGE